MEKIKMDLTTKQWASLFTMVCLTIGKLEADIELNRTADEEETQRRIDYLNNLKNDMHNTFI